MLITFLLILVKVVLILGVVLTMAAYLVLAERKLLARIQLRYGPNRAGPGGLLQPLADVVKLLTKEDFLPGSCRQVGLSGGSRVFCHRRHPRLRGGSLLGADSPFRPHHPDGGLRPQRRGALFPGALFAGGLRGRPRRLGLQLQVRAAGRNSRPGAAHLLRAVDGALARADHPLGPLLLPLGYRPGAEGHPLHPYQPAGLSHLPDQRGGRVPAHPLRSARGRERTGGRLSRRVFGHALRPFLRRRIHQHDHPRAP